jgi:hypothetical protein
LGHEEIDLQAATNQKARKIAKSGYFDKMG